jgi:BioD-like phosphotransacetylase family protein
MTKSVYVAATRQNDGKTTISIGMLQAFSSIYEKIGFIKPVGQQSVMVNDERIDKDTFLIQKIIGIQDDIKMMSPIAVPKGFTEDYINNRETKRGHLQEMLLTAYEKVAKNKEFVVIEGTGHAGVGSVFDFSNARVASLLNSKVIIVSKGGIGKPLDEIYMSKALFEKEGVEVMGVIMNQVLEEKYDKIKALASKSLEYMGLKLLGTIPCQEILSAPTMAQIKEHLNGELINGDYLHENIFQVVVGAMTAHHALNYLKKGTLLITPGDREDLILASLSAPIVCDNDEDSISGIVLTEGVMPHQNIFKLLQKTKIPVIIVKEGTYQTASKVHDLLVKITPQDVKKIELAKELVQKYVDIEYINNNL